ncbi:MAG: hypothetical protein ACTSPV_08860 [Candidatus Hodarchaeales archaeon]
MYKRVILLFLFFFSPVVLLDQYTISGSSQEYFIGQTQDFWVQDTFKAYNGQDDDIDGLVDFTEGDYDEAIYKISCRVTNLTTNSVVFVDTNLDISYLVEDLNSFSSKFEDIYSELESSFRHFPDVNNDGHVIVIVTDIRDESYYYSGHGSSILGFFWPVHSVPAGSGISAYSHYSEIVYIDVRAITPDPLFGSEILSHELQHLLQFSSHPDQDLWLDEGLSVFSERLCGFNDQIDMYHQSYFYDPFRSLIYFDQSPAAYGFSSLFVQYLYERFGISALKGIYTNDYTGLIAIVDTLRNDYPALTADRLFINFSLALYLQSGFDPWLDIDVDYRPGSNPQTSISSYPFDFDFSLLSWSFITFDIEPMPSSSVLEISFDSDTSYDSFGCPASLYFSLVEYNDTSSRFTTWLMDPFTCDSGFLITFDPSFSNHLLFLHSLAGVSGSPISTISVPSLNGSFSMTAYDFDESFFSPGFITVNASNYVFASSVRYYSDPYHEFTDTNTPIAKWRLFKYSNSNSYSPTGLTGDLKFSLSGWSLDRAIPLDNGEYFFEYEFFDGSHTISHFSDTFTVGGSQFNHGPNNAFPSIIAFSLVLASLVLAVYLLKTRRKKSHTTNLPPISNSRLSRDYSKPKTSSDPHEFSVREPTKFRRRRKY